MLQLRGCAFMYVERKPFCCRGAFQPLTGRKIAPYQPVVIYKKLEEEIDKLFTPSFILFFLPSFLPFFHSFFLAFFISSFQASFFFVRLKK
jgi:hypothetical protein